MLEVIDRSIRTGTLFELEHRVWREDGTLGWTSSRAVPVRNADGDIVEWFGAASDITERKRAEEVLRASEEQLQKAISIETVGVLFFNLDGHILGANSAFERMSTYKTEELRRIEHWKNLTAPEFWQVTIQTAERLAAYGKTSPYEKQMIRKDGSRWWGLFAPTRLAGSGGNSDCIEFIIDITESKKAEEEIKRLNTELAERAEELEAANRELETFNYTVAHDLRKPLTVINGYCQALAQLCSDKLDEECKNYIGEAYEGTRRMNRLIDALLLFSQAAHANPKRESVDLSATAQEVAKELKQAEPGRTVTFRIISGLAVEGDANLLRDVIANFFGNSWKFTADRVEAVIELGAFEIDGERVCFVRDNGIGFDSSEAGEIFTPFRRLSSGRRIGGLGIGLATVQRIIAGHGGKIWADSEPGNGATFFFTLGEAGAHAGGGTI